MKTKFRNSNVNRLINKDIQLEVSKPVKVNQNQALDSMKINASFAKVFYEFLTGVSNRLPSINSLIDLYNKAEYGAITMGYGIILNKSFEMSITTPIEKSKLERIDVISPSGYFAYRGRAGFAEEFHDGDREVRRGIDVNQDPIFAKGRIAHLIRYLAQCTEKVMSEKEENQVSLK